MNQRSPMATIRMKSLGPFGALCRMMTRRWVIRQVIRQVAPRFPSKLATRIFAALDRLSGGEDNPPTVLEALILERLEPLLHDWIDRNMPPLAERLMREEIRGLFEAARDEPVLSNDPDGKIRT